MRVWVSLTLQGARGLAVSTAATWWRRRGATAPANVGPDVGVVVAFAVDADELTSAIVEVVACSVAGGESFCEEGKVNGVEKAYGS